MGQLASNLNLQVATLRQKVIFDQAIVYFYVIATVENRGEYFVQKGCGPNFQGDLMTLCTCKHYMRSFFDADAWKNKWVAGFTGVKAGNGHNALVYLMRISQAFESHYEFWTTKTISTKAKRAKAAHLHIHGDIYKPRGATDDPFDPQNYVAPLDSHVHAKDNDWYKDISYVGCSGRKAALLAGDPKYSFLWDKPMIFYPSPLGRGQRKCDFGIFLRQLKAGDAL
jgi:hypothetical protein